jgi:hypothetical protein
MTSMAPSHTPNRTGEGIYGWFRIDRIFFLNCDWWPLYYDWRPLYHHSRPLNNDRRPLYNDRRSVNHDSLGNYGCTLLHKDARSRPVLDKDAWRRPVLVGLKFPRVNFPRANFPLMAGNFGITSDRQIGGHCR